MSLVQPVGMYYVVCVNNSLNLMCPSNNADQHKDLPNEKD